MEALLVSLLSGELSSTALLLAFIIAILTKRFVPWWTYEALLERLKVYEQEAPELIKDVKKLLTSLEEVKGQQKGELPRNPRRRHVNKRRVPTKKGGRDEHS